jgi:DNA-binding CsgD family transcriptional regulator
VHSPRRERSADPGHGAVHHGRGRQWGRALPEEVGQPVDRQRRAGEHERRGEEGPPARWTGYLLKGASREELPRALEAVGHGEVILGAAVGPAVLTRLMTRTERLTPFPQLIEREHEVLDLVARGMSKGDIARRLYLSEKMVPNVVSTVLTRLPAESRA